MISKGYTITVEDTVEMHNFKNSSAYGNYLKNIASSPAFTAIMQEHVNDIDISEDIKRLKNSGKLPDNVSAKALNEIFKQSLARMAVNLVADSIILKETEEIKMQEVIKELREDSAIEYLLGKADAKFYEQAAELVEQGKIDKNTIAFKGLMAYMKNKGILEKHQKEILPKLDTIKKDVKPTKKIIKKTKEVKALDMDSNDIEL